MPLKLVDNDIRQHGNAVFFTLAVAHNDLPVAEVNILDPIVAKGGGLQSQGVKGEAVILLLRTLDNEGSGVLRLSRRVENMPKSIRSFGYNL